MLAVMRPAAAAARRPLSVPGRPAAALSAAADHNGRQSQFGCSADQPRQQPVDSSRAPAPRRAEGNADHRRSWCSATRWPTGLPMGWRKRSPRRPRSASCASTRQYRADPHRARGESYDWPIAGARDAQCREAGLRRDDDRRSRDRRGIREAIAGSPRVRRPGRSRRPRQPAQTPAQRANRRSAGRRARTATPTPPARGRRSRPTPKRAPRPRAGRRRRSSDQPNVIAPEGATAGTVVHEFRSEKWGELYAKRVDEMIGVLKARNVPVFWVGLPSVRGARATVRDGLSQRSLPRPRREGGRHLCRHLGRLRRRRRQLQQLRSGLRGPDAAPALRRRRAFHPRRRAQARALCRARDPPRDAGACDAGRDAAAAGTGAGREGAAGCRRARACRRARSQAR